MRGMTLIELVIVFGMIGALSAVAITKINTDSGFKDAFYFNSLLSDIRYARMVGVLIQSPIKVSIDNTQSPPSLVLQKQPSSACIPANPCIETIYPPGKNDSSLSPLATQNISISSTNVPFYFDSLGRVYDATTQEIVSPTITMNGRTIVISGNTGFAYEQ